MADLNNITPMKGLPPFLQYFRTIGIIPASYKVTMTFEEQVLELMRFIRDEIIPKINENVLATQELQEKFKELVTYVDEYFENLDIQEEVNIKLDEMAESGDLAEIIAQYLESQAIIGFNNLSNLANAENLTNGSFARTFGKLTYNDGKGAFYKIRTRTNADVPDGDNIVVLVNTENLVAEKMPDDKLTYYYVKTTDSFEKIQNYFNDEKSKVIEFETGIYIFTDTFRLNSNTKIILNKSELIFNVPDVVTDYENSHGFFNFKADDEFMEYNGNGNIEVIGGTITGGNFSFCHAKNIVFKNIDFNLCKNDHIIELCGIDGCLIENCNFNGIYQTSANYKECINFDIADRTSFPFFEDENNPTYDNTPNKNITIKNCNFTNPNTLNYTFDCAIGNHGISTDAFHENIIFENNNVENSTNLGIDIYNFKNVIIRNNIFDGNAEQITNNGSHIITHNKFENLLIENNKFNGGFRAISYSSPNTENGNKNLKIINNEFLNFTHTTENISILNIHSTDICQIIGNIFKNILCGCIRTNFALQNSSKEYFIEKNTFNSSLVSESIIKAYDGISHITNNIFDTTITANVSAITLSGDSNIVYIAGNKYNDNLLTNNKILYFSSYDNSRKNIENIKTGWSGASSSLTNQSLSDNLKFSDYKKIILTIGYGGETHTIQLTGWNPLTQAYLDARTYRIYFGTGYVELKINNDETFNYSQSGTNLQLRNIVLINEN